MGRRGLFIIGAALSAVIGCGGSPLSQAPQDSVRPLSAPSTPNATPRRPSVVLFVVDDLNTTLGCYGIGAVRTPRIDALAARGVRFSRAYAPYPMCNPSRSSLLTGLLPETLGVLDGVTHFRAHRPGVVSLPQLLRRNGYYAVGLSKVFHDQPGMDDSQEWDEARTFQATPRGLAGTGEDLSRDGQAWRWLAADGDDIDQPDGQAARAAVEFLARRPSRPFFLAIGLTKPHEPFVAPRKYFDSYPLQGIALAAVPPDDRRDIPAVALPAPCGFTSAESRSLTRAYYASVSFMDAQVGVVLDALEREGLTDETLVVFVGDNGLHLGEHFHWGKATLFEPATRVPLIFAGPGVTAVGQVSPRPVELTSLFASVAELTNVPPGAVDGLSLLPLLGSPEAPWGAAYSLCAPVGVLGRSVRTERWRYTEWGGGARGRELYDEDVDPNEWTNRAADPSYAATLTELSVLLRRRWPAVATSAAPDVAP